jgi:hypothetical protein
MFQFTNAQCYGFALLHSSNIYEFSKSTKKQSSRFNPFIEE